MKGTSGERERDEPPGALSLGRLKPFPAGLSLSLPRWAARLASGPKPRFQCTARRFSYRSWGRSEGEIIRLYDQASGQSLKIRHPGELAVRQPVSTLCCPSRSTL